MIAANSQIYIDNSRFKRLMAEQSLNGHKISAVLIEMSAEGMTERMAGDTPWPAEIIFMLMDVSG